MRKEFNPLAIPGGASHPDGSLHEDKTPLSDLEQVAAAKTKNETGDPNKKETFGQWIDKALEEFPEIKEFIEGTSEIFALVKEVSLDFLETTKGLLDKEQVGGLLKKVSKDIKGAPNKVVAAAQSLLHYFSDKVDSLKTKRSNYKESGKFEGAPPTENSRKAFDYLKGKLPELNEIQIAGIIGNLQQESYADLRTGVPGDGGHSLGIAQWNDSKDVKRKTHLKNFINKNGKDIYKLEDQLDFLIAELKGEYPGAEGALEALKRATTLEEATIAFEEKFEKAGTPNIGKRIVNAENTLKDAQKRYYA